MGQAAGCASTHAVNHHDAHNVPEEAKEKRTRQQQQQHDDTPIVELPKRAPLRLLQMTTTEQEGLETLKRSISERLVGSLIAHCNHTHGPEDYVVCVYPNQDRSVLIYAATNGLDKMYYHVRDASAIRNDVLKLSKTSDDLLTKHETFFRAVQKSMKAGHFSFHLNGNCLTLNQTLHASNAETLTSIPMYLLEEGVDVNTRDIFMMITKSMAIEKQLEEVPVHAKKQQTDSKALVMADSTQKEDTASEEKAIEEVMALLKEHENEEVRKLVTDIETILSKTNSKTHTLARALVSQASAKSMMVKHTVKDLIVSNDQETQKWLNGEVLAGSDLVEDNTDNSWKRKIKAYTKAIFFTSKLMEMSAERKSSTSLVDEVIELPNEINNYLKEHFFNFLTFDVFKFYEIANKEPIYYSCLFVFKHFELPTLLNIPVKTIKSFLKEVEAQYLNNPYHNHCHATDVVQSAFSLYHGLFLSKSGQGNTNFTLSAIDVLALVVATVSHDVCHPGYSNLFEKKTRSERAIMFNDRSILENFHCYSLFKILGKQEHNIFANLATDQYEYVRDMIVEMILATDISQHFQIVGQIKSNDLFNREKFSTERKECLLGVMKVLIKCADVSNPTKADAVYLGWVDRVMSEFYAQGDKERKLGMSISPFMDRRSENVPKCQTGFIEFIVSPLFTLLFDFKPEETLHIKEQLVKNQKTMVEKSLVNEVTLDKVLGRESTSTEQPSEINK